LIGTCVSHYRILEKLGSGGMGEVFAAEDTHLGRRVAIKFPILKSDGSDHRVRFLKEARAASQLDHPNIARIYDYGEAPDGRPFLVMELVKGTSLRQVLRDGPLPPASSIGIVEGVLRGLREAHRTGLIHRDIKPANVMLAESGDVKVLDFGLAKPILDPPTGEISEAATIELGPTHPGVVRGTPEYMSPEQARGGILDGRSDLFSTGLVLYECLTGRPAFSGGTGHEVLDKVIHADPPPPSSYLTSIPASLDHITAKALAKDPAQRYQNAGEMLDDLASAAAALSRSASLSVRTAVAGLVGSRRRLLWVGIPALALAVLAGWLLWRSGSPEPSPAAMGWYQRGAVALRDGTYYRAQKALEQAVALDPGFSLAHARLAEARSELDDSEGANQEMLAALPTRSSRAPRGVAALYVDAIHRTLQRDFPGAIRGYADLAGRVSQAEKSAVLVDLGRAYEKADQSPKALETYREAIRLDPQSAAAHLRAAILMGRQRMPEGTAEFARAESLYHALSNTEGQAEVLYQRGRLASAGPDDLPAARRDLEEAIQLTRTIGSEYQEIAATLQLSIVAILEGNPEQAEKDASSAVARARRDGMVYLAARGLIDLGSAQFRKGEYERAAANFQEARDVSRRFHMLRNEAAALFSLASLHQQQGASDAAVTEIGPALDFYRQSGFRHEELQCLIVIARSYRDQGKDAEALAAFEKGATLAQALDDQTVVALSEQGIGSVLYQQDRLPEALVHYERYYEAASRRKNREGIGRGLVGRANILWRLGRYPEAEAVLKEADTLAGPPGNPSPLAALIAERRAGMALSRGQLREAVAQARRSYESTTTPAPNRAYSQCLAGLALARAGSAREGKQLCDEGLTALIALKEENSVADGRLAMAETLILAGEPQAAQEQIRLALQVIDAGGHRESGWRAWALAARACRWAGDRAQARDAAKKASAYLSDLQAAWKADFDRYIQRPDLQALQRDLQE